MCIDRRLLVNRPEITARIGKDDEDRQRFWTLYEDLDFSNTWLPFYRFVFLLRRILIAVAVVLVQKLVFQLFIAFFQSTLMIITIGQIRPFTEESRNRKELVNEVIIISSLYFIMCFSAYVPSTEAQDMVGYGLCLMMAVHCGVHLLIIMYTSVINTFKNIRY